MGRRAGQGRGSYALLPRAQATREPIWIEKAVPGHDGQLARSRTHALSIETLRMLRREEERQSVRPFPSPWLPGSLLLALR